MGGPSAEQFWFKDDHSPVYDYSRFDVDSPASYRRSVYRFIVRSVPDPFMDRLDCPDASLITAKRNTTITAIQALALLNNPFMVRQAEHLAARVKSLAEQPDEQIAWIYRLALGRDPDRRETERLAQFAARHGLENAAPGDLEQQRVSVCGLRTIMDRRQFLWNFGGGLGGIALAQMLNGETHFPAKAKRVVQLFMSGAASQCDTFDYKPELIRRNGEKFDPGGKVELFQSSPGAVMKSPWEWKQRGQCGKWISDLVPHIASCADDIAFVHSMVAKSNVHGPATFMQNTGFVLPGFPCMGSWVSYGLGSMNENLPTFIVLPDSRGFAPNGPANWSAGFLPAVAPGHDDPRQQSESDLRSVSAEADRLHHPGERSATPGSCCAR